MSKAIEPEQLRGVLGAAIAECFLQNACVVPVGEVDALRGQVAQHLADVHQALSCNEFIDIDVAEDIARVCLALLALYESLEEELRAAVVGAVRYFASQDDAENDFESVIGFDDDVRVINYVIELIGADIAQILPGAKGQPLDEFLAPYMSNLDDTRIELLGGVTPEQGCGSLVRSDC